MAIIPLPERIENYQERTSFLRELAPTGYVFAINYSLKGPEYFDTTMPEAWQAIYQERGYFLRDPIFLWTLTHTGYKRWSNISFTSNSRVLQEATKYGLNYGAIFVRKKSLKVSWCSVSRPDRELTDEELDSVDTLLDDFLRILEEPEALTSEERMAIKAYAEGANQKEVAEALRISEGKVKNLIRSTKKKLGCKSLAQVVGKAIEKKLI